MKKIYYQIIIIILIVYFTFGTALSFDNEYTHKELTAKAIDHSQIDNILKNNLGLLNGVHEYFQKRTIIDWLREGSFLEDEPGCRASNHFHNPLKSWTESGMSDQPWFVNWWCSGGEYPPGNIKSNVHWATGYTEPAPAGAKIESGNQWDWDYARENYFIYLTGKDYNGDLVAATQAEREFHFTLSLQALGQVLHLLQDMAVPAHVRNDFKSHLDWAGITINTIFRPTKWFRDRFEYYVQRHIRELLTGSVGGNLDDVSLTKLWDTNAYNGANPGISTTSPNLIGLAEYTNINFASKNTIFAESKPTNDVYYNPYPRKTSTDVQDYINRNKLPETVTGEDNKPDTMFHIKKVGDGEIITNFATPVYLTRDLQNYDERVFYRSFEIDDECANDYAESLIPRAVGYSSALLKYFFRGELEVDAAVPVIIDDYIWGIAFYIKNMTSTEEALEEGGIFHLKHEPTTGSPADGTTAPQSALAYNEKALVYLWFDQPITISDDLATFRDAVCTIAFKGGLGSETEAVIGKVFKLETALNFNEDWYSLAGNYPWDHTTADDNPDNGATINEVLNGVLIKDNIRFADADDQDEKARYNETSLNLMDAVNPNGIPITSSTYIEYKIDDMSIVNKPEATPGYTSDYQVVNLFFNNGLIIELFYDAGISMSATTAYWSFSPGYIIIDNIYKIFQAYSIAIPEPLYLESIYFTQQLLPSPDSPLDTSQHMKVDYFRIIDGKTSSP